MHNHKLRQLNRQKLFQLTITWRWGDYFHFQAIKSVQQYRPNSMDQWFDSQSLPQQKTYIFPSSFLFETDLSHIIILEMMATNSNRKQTQQNIFLFLFCFGLFWWKRASRNVGYAMQRRKTEPFDVPFLFFVGLVVSAYQPILTNSTAI